MKESMSLNRKSTLSFFVLFFILFLSLKQSFSADIIKIRISDLEPTLEVLQGTCETAPFYITNQHNESVHIYYRIDKPSDMEITSYPKDYTLLTSGATIAGNLNVCVNEYFENDTYNIKFWIETLTKVNESRVRSDKYTLGIVVLNNPNLEIATTTSTISETTTIRSQVIKTVPVYTPTSTTTVKSFDIHIDKPKIGNLVERKELVTVGIIIIVLVLVMIPYFTFVKKHTPKADKMIESQPLFFQKNK